MTTQVRGEGTAVAWPLARRVVAGLARPGGAAMTRRALEGAGLGEADRVVELAPGLGLTSRQVLDARPRSWTGVEPDADAVEHLRRIAGDPGRDVVEAPVDGTGLPDGEASVVVIDSLLSTLDAPGRAAALAEAARLLRAGGRVALHELAPADDADEAALERIAAAGLTPLGEGARRAEAEAAGLVVVGSLTGALRLPEQRELMREAGARGALRITRGVALDHGLRSAALRARHALSRDALALRSVIVVAEVPLILGLRRPRR
jgi:SAM-dependent methyltransferase